MKSQQENLPRTKHVSFEMKTGNKYTCILLKLSMLGKNFNRQQTDDIFSYFSQKIGFGISCKLSPEISSGDNLHEMPKPIFWEK